MKKKESLKKITLSILTILLVSSPFVYLFVREEYDKSQVFVPQRFDEEKYEIIDSSEHLIMQMIVAEGDNFAGFDLQSEDCQIPSNPIQILNKDHNELTVAKLDQSILVNKCDVLNYRFEAIENSQGRIYYIRFPQDERILFRYLKHHDLMGGQLFFDGKEQAGNLNLVPIYKSRSLIKVIFDRLDYQSKEAGGTILVGIFSSLFLLSLGFLIFEIYYHSGKNTGQKNDKKSTK
ncbi:MAG: hypothetical protein PHS44_00590 [Candidatus Dojkabacteria bacterium]|nr:hypothetical protein [Candidatus Dojkabacteria bacterium]